MMSSASTAVYETGRWRSLGREPIRWIVMASWWMVNGPRENIGACWSRSVILPLLRD